MMASSEVFLKGKIRRIRRAFTTHKHGRTHLSKHSFNNKLTINAFMEWAFTKSQTKDN